MKSALPRLAVLAGLWAALCVNFAFGQTIRFRSTEASSNSGESTVAVAGESTSPFVPEAQAAQTTPASPAVCADGCGCGTECGCGKSCGCGCGCPADCDDCPGYGLELWSGVEAYHNVTDTFYQRNLGIDVGGNVGVPIPKLREYGIGAQFGVGYHAADFDGRFLNDNLTFADTSSVQEEIFLTTGLFRRAFAGESFFSHFNMGIAHDWLLTNEFGQYAQSPTLGQWRGQLGYA